MIERLLWLLFRMPEMRFQAGLMVDGRSIESINHQYELLDSHLGSAGMLTHVNTDRGGVTQWPC